MKQKIVIRVCMHHGECCKCRSKALQIAVSIPGVERAALTGQEKDHVEVEGDCIDSVELTSRLRKKLAHAVLVSVGEIKKPAPPVNKPPEPPKPVVQTQQLVVAPPCYPVAPPCYPPYQCCEVVDSNIYGPSCTIL